MEEASILKWLKKEGEEVTCDTLLFELETDKAILEVSSPAPGILLKIGTASGPVRVEDVVGWVGAPGESAPTPHVQDNSASKVTVDSSRSPKPVAAHTGQSSPSTPAARRRAVELGLDIASIQGSGPGGRVVQEDVERAAAAASEPGVGARVPSRGELARGLSLAWQTIPHIHISRRLECDGIAETAGRLHAPGISVTDLLLFAVSRLLPSFPELTQTWRADRLEPASATHVAFAVNTESGVVAPVIRDASTLTIEQISEQRRELSGAARAHRLKLTQLDGGVFTLTNLGMQGVDFFAPIVNWPQTAILATGRMTQEPIVRDGSVTTGWRMWANLAVDHRAADGASGAKFLAELQHRTAAREFEKL